MILDQANAGVSVGMSFGAGVCPPTRALLALARAQHGVVTTSQLFRVGVSRKTASVWARDGRLVRIHRGVYAVGHDVLTDMGRRMAAVLAIGPRAAITGISAGQQWGYLPGWIPERRVEVVNPRTSTIREICTFVDPC
ncbi:MAG: hypothetical protein JWO69_1125, partial [Thermoleophilia bacterium]|nr:hypothetical protein [Thermoleophilia bacterium]